MGLLDEVAPPQYTSRIRQDSHVNRDHGGILLNNWATLAGLGTG